MIYIIIGCFLLIGVLFFIQIKNKKEKNALKKELSNLAAENYRNYMGQFDLEKSKTALQPIQTQVAGVTYSNDKSGSNRQKIISKLKVNEKLLLIPEENNPYDANAVRVCRLIGEQIGYLNADLALEIQPRLKEKTRVDARVVKISGTDRLDVTIEIIRFSRKREPRIS